jgi:hypothetical protein
MFVETNDVDKESNRIVRCLLDELQANLGGYYSWKKEYIDIKHNEEQFNGFFWRAFQCVQSLHEIFGFTYDEVRDMLWDHKPNEWWLTKNLKSLELTNVQYLINKQLFELRTP